MKGKIEGFERKGQIIIDHYCVLPPLHDDVSVNKMGFAYLCTIIHLHLVFDFTCKHFHTLSRLNN